MAFLGKVVDILPARHIANQGIERVYTGGRPPVFQMRDFGASLQADAEVPRHERHNTSSVLGSQLAAAANISQSRREVPARATST